MLITKSLITKSNFNDSSVEYTYTSRLAIIRVANRAMELGDLFSSKQCWLANTPALLLVSDAGTGKSHLFCNVAKRRVEARLPSVLLLGKNFSKEEPWSQITKMLGLTCGTTDLLGDLEAAAQAANAKALILIDALNDEYRRYQ
jgi:hypothetical protein